MSGELRVLIADDERLARDRMVRLLGALDVRVVAACPDGQALLDALETERVDAVFLDLEMPGLRGDEVAELLGSEGPLLVFATAHSQHAVDAFAQGAVDYLLKPFSRDRLQQAVERLRTRLTPIPSGDTRLALPTARGLRLLDPEDVRWCGIDGESVVVHTGEGEVFSSLRLTELERRLPACFRRVHRRALVNLDRVVELLDTPIGGYRARFDDGSEVEVSRAAARRLRRELLGD
ncbi:MAG: response regulator transcription factor [Deltaproteobacteria bacterium]|nr:MAG: response regulator transcription factor [Deltaproteobacteria bacterium]